MRQGIERPIKKNGASCFNPYSPDPTPSYPLLSLLVTVYHRQKSNINHTIT